MSSSARGSFHDDTDAMPYGAARGMDKALDAFFASRDPKEVKLRSLNSSGARAKRNVIQNTPEMDLIMELLRRQRLKRKREMATERQRRRRALLSRRKA